MAESLNLIKLEEALRLWSNKSPAGLSCGPRKMLELETSDVINDATEVELATRNDHNVIDAPSRGLESNAGPCDGLDVNDADRSRQEADDDRNYSDTPNDSNSVKADDKVCINQKTKTKPVEAELEGSSEPSDKKSWEEASKKLKMPVVVLERLAIPDMDKFIQKSRPNRQEPEKTAGFNCANCSLVFPNPEQLHIHNLLIHIQAKPDPVAAAVTELTISGFRCGPCKVTFDVESKMKDHLNSVHNVKSAFACILCSLTFATANGMQLHIELSHQPFKCKVCLKSFTEKSLLQDHLDKQHTGYDDGYGCSFCSRYVGRYLQPLIYITFLIKTRPGPLHVLLCSTGYMINILLQSYTEPQISNDLILHLKSLFNFFS